MKRALASLISLGTLLGYAAPAYALYKPETQPRLELRMAKRATLASYSGRHNREYVRARYNELVRSMVTPAFLTKTGGPRSDSASISRAGTRYLQTLAGADHCLMRCHDEGLTRN